MEAQDRSCSLVYIYFSGATVRALLAQRVVVRSARNGNRVEDAASLGRGRSRLERRKTYELTLGATAPTSLYGRGCGNRLARRCGHKAQGRAFLRPIRCSGTRTPSPRELR